MMPPKRGSGRDEENLQSPSTSTWAPAKRRRVSLACNPCRAAREKCDGEKPHCGACASQHRNCSYTISSKKRGVQTGYLRTIELALAWVLDEVPESESALQRLLTDNGGREGAKLLTKKNSNGHHLHKKWNRSRVHKEIARILADGELPRKDAGSESGEEDGDTPTASSIRSDNLEGNDGSFREASQHIGRCRPLLKLPRHWRRLVDIYYTYTHCWLPIVDKQTLLATISEYPPEGLQRGWEAPHELSPNHTELWAVFALASFQDRKARPTDDNEIEPVSIYSISRKLLQLQNREDMPDWPQVRAMLLHSLILMGQGNLSGAWCLVGTATRASLCLRAASTDADLLNTHQSRHRLQQAITTGACFVLDVWLSLSLGQQPQMHPGSQDKWYSEQLLSSLDIEEEEPWAAMSGFTSDIQDASTVEQAMSRPLQTLYQLLKFSETICVSLNGRSHGCAGTHKMVPEDLAKTLDPRFSYCNSLMGTTPAIPSAFVLQAVFLAGTVALSSTCRPSVFSTFSEVIENNLSTIGPTGSPPIFYTLMDFMQRQTKTNVLKPTMETLRNVWTPTAADMAQELSPNMGHESAFSQEFSSLRRYTGSTNVEEDRNGAHAKPPASLPTTYLSPHADFQAPTISSTTNLEAFLSLQSGGTSYDTPGTDRMYAIPTPQSGYGQTQLMDYDSILDQLGSIDCTDSIDLDPQFMVNLGFAPGCGFGDPGFDET